MIYLLYTSLAIFVLYVASMCIIFKKIPNSVSQTYYLMKDKYGLGILFTVFCWGVVFTLAPYMLNHSDDYISFAAFLALAGMLFVGSAPLYIEDFEGKVHTSGATVCIVASQIWSLYNCWWVALLCWVVYVIGTIVYIKAHKEDTFKKSYLRTKPMFWLEITAFASTYATIFLG